MISESLEKKLLIIREWLLDYRVNSVLHNKNDLHSFTFYEKYRRQYKDFILRFDLWFSRDRIAEYGLWINSRPVDFEALYDLMPTDLKLKMIYISEADDD